MTDIKTTEAASVSASATELENTKSDFRFILEKQSETNRSLIKALMISIVAGVLGILITIGGFLWYMNQYDYSGTSTVTEITGEQDGDGVNIIGGGDVHNGAEGYDKDNGNDQDAE